MSVQVRGLSKSYGGGARVLDDVSIECREGELLVVLGPSGGGKSTLLRLIAGLDSPDSGEVWVQGERVDAIHPAHRRMGFVFQHYALFRHLTVFQNVAFGLRAAGVHPANVTVRVKTLLEILGLRALADHHPTELSGGQQQRVALARALAPRPKVLLLDEPFSALDLSTRLELRRWLRKVHDGAPTTTILVTHDQDEAFAVADRVAVLHGGRVEQVGPPADILDRPATEFVSRFVGDVNVFSGEARGGSARFGPLAVPIAAEGPVSVVVRAYDLKFWRDDAGVATVSRVVPVADRVRVEATLDGGLPIHAQFPRRSTLLHGVAPGARIAVEVTSARVWPG